MEPDRTSAPPAVRDGDDRQRDLAALAGIEVELADVEHALERLDEGSYGGCEACGRPIDDGRLEAAPAARFCGDHAGAGPGSSPAAPA